MYQNQCTRTNAYNHLKAGVDATDQPITNSGDDTRYSDFVAAHERVFSKDTEDQLPERDQDDLDKGHHDCGRRRWCHDWIQKK